jgi:hypothetical protein
MTLAAAALRIAAPVLVWAAHFAAVYGGTALACARSSPQAVAWTIGASTLAACALAAAIVAYEWPNRARFESWLATSLGAFALVAMIAEALVASSMPPCR